MSKEALVLFSGGLDSLCCAFFLRQKGFTVEGLFVDYGQSAVAEEKDASKSIAAEIELPLRSVRIASNERFSTGEIPGRNFLLVAAALTFGDLDSGLIGMGIHSGTAYYDCSPQFTEALDRLVREQTNGNIGLIAPFSNWAKQDIFEYAIRVGIPIDLTYSCECGGPTGCGECLSCRDRKNLDVLRNHVP